jgi:uncharacterized membrane protein
MKPLIDSPDGSVPSAIGAVGTTDATGVGNVPPGVGNVPPGVGNVPTGVGNVPLEELRLTNHPVFLVVFALITSFFVAITWLSYKSFHCQNIEDLANVNQVVYNFVSGNTPGSSLNEVQNSLTEEHFRLIFLLFAPLYIPFKSAYFFVFLSVIFTGITVYALTRIAERFFGWKTAAVFFPIILMYPSIANMYLTFMGKDLVLAAGFLSLSLMFYIENRFRPWVASLVLASFCTEYISLIFVGYAFASVLHGKGRKWAVFSLSYGLGYFLLVCGFIMPHFRDSGGGFAGAHFSEFQYIGNTPYEIAKNLITSPVETLGILTESYKMRIHLLLLGLLLFIPLIGAEYLLIPFSQLLIMHLPKSTAYTDLGLFYHAPIVPFIFVAAFVGIVRLKRFFDVKPVIIAAIIFLSIFLRMSIPYYNTIRINLNNAVRSYDKYDMALYAYLKTIPEDASISTQESILPAVSSRSRLYWYPRIDDADYVIIGIGRHDYGEQPFKSMLLQDDYGVIFISNKDIVIKKGYPTTRNREAYMIVTASSRDAN